MKKEFEQRKFEIILFVNDVITTSGGGNTGEWNGNEGWV